MVSWIINNILFKLGCQQSFNFGMYLTQYIAYQLDCDRPFPKQFTNFLKARCGIRWKITPNSALNDENDSSNED